MNIDGWILHDPKQWKINLLVLAPNVDPLTRDEYATLKKILAGQIKHYLLVYYTGDARYVMLNFLNDPESRDEFKNIQSEHIHHNLLQHYKLNGECYYLQIRGNEFRNAPSGVPDSIKKLIKNEIDNY